MQNNDFKLYAKLLEQARNGDDRAFRELYRYTWPAQEYHLQSILEKPEDVKDALQEVYLLLYKNMDKVNPPTVLIAYLNRLSYHVGKNMARREYYRTASPIDTEWMKEIEEPEALEALNNTEKAEQLLAVRKALDQLPKEEKNVVFMRYYQKLKHNEVALSLKIPVAKAKRLQKSAQKHLREILNKQGIMTWGVLVGEAFGIHEAKASSSSSVELRSGHANSSIISRLSKIPKSALFTGIAAAGLSAVVAGAISLPGGPEIRKINIPSETLKAEAQLSFEVTSAMPVTKVTVTGENGHEIHAVSSDGSHFTAPISENGTYVIAASARSGKTAQEETEVTCFDQDSPEVTTLEEENGMLAVTFKENGSGLDYNSIYCETKNGTVIKPSRIDEGKQRVWFPLPKEEQKLFVSDLSGNTGCVPVFRHEN